MGDMDAAFRALAADRRRIALSYLQDHHSMALPDLAELVAEEEQGKKVVAIDDELIKDVYLSLYHTHLPELEKAGFVEYEQEHDLIAVSDQLNSLLRSVRESVLALQQTAP